MAMSKKAILMILDGWGLNPDPTVSAIAAAQTPYMDRVMQEFPSATLEASGLAVGLPEGQMGNSEVGHMNLGAGRVVYQNLVRIGMAAKDGSLAKIPEIHQAFALAKEKNAKLHFIGLVSDGGVHAHIDHLKALLKGAAEFDLEKVFVHAFTDGRDCDPHSGKKFIADLLDCMKEHTGQLASITGRYYAMDRDKRWERVKLAYDAMTKGIGTASYDALDSIEKSYQAGISDEFLAPIVMQGANHLPVAKIENGDVVIMFNFRTDRGREITEVLTQEAFPDYDMQPLALHYVTLTCYDETYKNVHVVFRDEVIKKTLGEVIAENGKTQIRTAETEKYPHVTFFFSGGREEVFPGERRLLSPSPKDVPTYDLKPEMAAGDITKNILPEIEKETADFICLNFANTDMVGHTGSFEAAKKSAEYVDTCVAQVAQTAYEHEYTVFILADHGNSDVMKNPDGTPNTQHSTNKVPLIVMSKEKTWKVKNGKLGDIAPSILTAMELPIPKEMTGDILIS